MNIKSVNFLISLFIIINLGVLLSGNAIVYRVLFYNLAEIDDYKIFPNRYIKPSTRPKPWPYAQNYKTNSLSSQCSELLTQLKTVAVLIIKNDSIKYEQYWDKYSRDSYSSSFSMAKSYISALIGIALKEGLIENIDQKVSDFLPEFKEGKKSQINIRHLLTMSSGLDWKENYFNPFSTVSKAYYGADLRKIIRELKVKEEPGKVFRYKGGDTQILAFILEQASGKSLSHYAEEKLWFPLGAVTGALWSLDHENGEEKASCCLNSNVHDFARLGKLYLDTGKVNGKEIIPAEYVQGSISVNGLKDSYDKQVDYYGYQWWIIPNYKSLKIFYARGVLGQYIIVVPKANMVIVRLGKKRGQKIGNHFEEIFQLIEEGLRMK